MLTAGLGTRLRPLTWLRAKPALPVAGEPLVHRILKWLRGSGVDHAVLNLHHRPESIAAVVGDGSALGLRVRYSWEQPILGSAGGIRRAFGLVEGDELLVVNGDTLTDVDVPALLAAHRASGALVTMAVIPNPSPEAYGGVRIDEEGRVGGFARRGSAEGGWHFVGAQVVARQAFATLLDGAPAESVGALYPTLMRERPGSVHAFTTRATFLDVGTPATYLETCLACAEHPNQLTGEGSRVSRDARVTRSVLWEGVTVEPGAELSGCIVTDRVVVPRGARYHAAILLRRDDVPEGTGRVDDGIVVAPLARPE